MQASSRLVLTVGTHAARGRLPRLGLSRSGAAGGFTQAEDALRAENSCPALVDQSRAANLGSRARAHRGARVHFVPVSATCLRDSRMGRQPFSIIASAASAL